MKRILAVAAFLLAAGGASAYAAAPEAIGEALAGCCAFMTALMSSCCPC